MWNLVDNFYFHLTTPIYVGAFLCVFLEFYSILTAFRLISKWYRSHLTTRIVLNSGFCCSNLDDRNGIILADNWSKFIFLDCDVAGNRFFELITIFESLNVIKIMLNMVHYDYGFIKDAWEEFLNSKWEIKSFFGLERKFEFQMKKLKNFKSFFDIHQEKFHRNEYLSKFWVNDHLKHDLIK